MNKVLIIGAGECGRIVINEIYINELLEIVNNDKMYNLENKIKEFVPTYKKKKIISCK